MLMPAQPEDTVQNPGWLSGAAAGRGTDTCKCRMNGCQNYGAPPVGTSVYVCDSCVDEFHDEIEHENNARRHQHINT
jgi:hypothetical protein